MILYPEDFPIATTLDLALIMFNLVGYIVGNGTFEGGKYAIAGYGWSDGKVAQHGKGFVVVVVVGTTSLGSNDKQIHLLLTAV